MRVIIKFRDRALHGKKHDAPWKPWRTEVLDYRTANRIMREAQARYPDWKFKLFEATSISADQAKELSESGHTIYWLGDGAHHDPERCNCKEKGMRKLLAEMTEEELLDYRAEMEDQAAPYLERIRAIDTRVKALAEESK